MKRGLLFVSLFVFVLLFTSFACGCTLAPAYSIFKCKIRDSLFQQNFTCLNDACSVNVTKSNYYGRLILIVIGSEWGYYIDEKRGVYLDYFYWLNEKIDHQDIISSFDKICEENIDDLKPILYQVTKNWSLGSRGNSASSHLIFEPYSKERESELIKSKNNYRNCYYEDYKKVGNWLIISGEIREYCYMSGGGGGMCPRAKMSHTKFVGFLLTHINAYTIPYLIGYLLVIAVIIYFTVYLIKRREFGIFLRPNLFNILFPSILGVFMLIPFMLLFGIRDFVLFIVGLYLLLSLIKYLKFRKNNKINKNKQSTKK
jgi:hypothetical protein